MSTTNANSNNTHNSYIIFSKTDYIRLIIIILTMMFISHSINKYYFSSDKVSYLSTSDNKKILYPSEQKLIQKFTCPTDKIAGINIYFTKDADDNDSSIYLSLADANLNAIKNVEISSSDNISNYYFSLDNVNFEKNEDYYLVAWSDKESTIGILASDITINGYKSSNLDGYTWCYSIVYDAFSPYIIVCEIIFIILIIIAYISLIRKVKEENLLSLLYFALAFIFFISTPINTSFDEEGHFLRSYELAHGHILSGHYDNGMGKTTIPQNLYEGITYATESYDDSIGGSFIYKKSFELLKNNIEPATISVPNPNQALYSPASYIPQTIGLIFANLVTDNIFLYYFYGRFVAFFINTLLIIASINMIPDKRRLVFAICSTPIFLIQMVSYSADGTLNSLSIFFISYIIKINKQQMFTSFNKVIVFICVIIISLSKVIFFPLALLILLLDGTLFATKKSSLLYKTVTIGTAFIFFILWFIIARTYLFDSLDENSIQPMNQLQYAITHIYTMPTIAFNTAYHNLLNWVGQFFGGKYLYSNTIWFIFSIIIISELLTYPDDEIQYNITITQKHITIISITLIIILIFGSLYIQWTSYRADLISGIQGRYFIPLVIPFAYVINRKKIEGSSYKRILTDIILIIIANMCAIINTYQIYI